MVWKTDTAKRWDVRIRRARELGKDYPPAESVLRFYESVLCFQRELARSCSVIVPRDVSVRDQIDVSIVSSHIPKLLSLMSEAGIEVLRSGALSLQTGGSQRWTQLLQSALREKNDLTPVEDFFARACLQPVAENIQLQLPTPSNYLQASCPACGGPPQAAVLRPEGEGASRSLLCSFCLREWSFRRVICPSCGEEDKEKLPRYSAEEYKYAYVEACDTCMRYIKAIDMTIDGRAVPLVDEAALAVLDVWATERGYTKLMQNLLGF